MSYQLPALRDIDRERGEFWVGNPFLFSSAGENLSAYERNGIHLNSGDGRFFDISYLTGADSPGDGRTAVFWDITGDGMPEILVRQVGGGALLVFENRFPRSNWLRISLRGAESNRLGIGSKISCQVNGKTIRRELYPAINFLSQTPSAVHLGLGAADRIDSLQIRWPSGKLQTFQDVPLNRHLLFDEAGNSFTRVDEER